MKFLTDRKEIAKAINIDKLPVITFDLTKPMEGYDGCYEGTKVKVEGAYSGQYAHLDCRCTPHIWDDELHGVAVMAPWMVERIPLNEYGFCIHDSFSLHDIEEMVMWNNAPSVHAEDKVVVFFKAKNLMNGKPTAFLRLMKVNKRLSPNCSTVTYLEDAE